MTYDRHLRVFRHVASLLLVVMLATVLAPAFAWEAIGGEAMHGDRTGTFADGPLSDHHHGAPEREGPALHDHVECVGHTFTHLSTAHALRPETVVVNVADKPCPGAPAGKRSCTPKIPEHPPRDFPRS